MILLLHEPLDPGAIAGVVRDPAAGGIDVFIGTVRSGSGGREVIALEFEAYEPMALREMQAIAAEAAQRWKLVKTAVVHALGRRECGEPVVVIAVSAPHRAAAFEACRYIIDELKKRVPIWKKEIFADGEAWVQPHP
jgi:molybdopterin synthase catalytic subunit